MVSWGMMFKFAKQHLACCSREVEEVSKVDDPFPEEIFQGL